MKIRLEEAALEKKKIFYNLGLLYAYDMSKYCGHLLGWDLPESGMYLEGVGHLDSYWEEETRHPFLIYAGNEPAGFALINKIGSHDAVDWNIAEFFVTRKFQGQGVGRRVARELFSRFSGIWNVMVMPQNTAALHFWDSVVRNFKGKAYTKEQVIIPEPTDHAMIVLEFEVTPER